MFDWNGKRPSVLRTKRPAVWSALDRTLRILPLALPQSVRLGFVLTLAALALLLTACATPSGTPTEHAKNPPPPQLSEPLPSESYLNKAQRLIESWRNRVIGM